MKFCNICKTEKDLSNFSIRDNGKYRNDCKQCRSLYLKEYRKGNKNNPYKLEINSTKTCRVCKVEKEINDFVKSKRICKLCQKEYLKKRYLENKENELMKSKIRYQENKEEIKKKNSYYSKNNREKINSRSREYKKRVLKNDPLWLLKNRISSGIRRLTIKKGLTKTFSVRKNWENILGCSVEQFVYYIESQFLEGMSWENSKLWHIDHIVPQSFAESIEEVIMLNHYTNLKPLWEKDNIIKSDSIVIKNKIYKKIIELRSIP